AEARPGRRRLDHRPRAGAPTPGEPGVRRGCRGRRHRRLEYGPGRRVPSRHQRRRHAEDGRHPARAVDQAGYPPQGAAGRDRLVQGPRGGPDARPGRGGQLLPDQEQLPRPDVPRHGDRPDRGAPGMRVAIVKDMARAREASRRSVTSAPGHEVAWVACDGAEAVEQARSDRPDLILMDLIMPRVDGVEATRRIMAEAPCPILVVTSTVSGN